MRTFTDSEATDHIIDKGINLNLSERDKQNQVVIYTGIYEWSDGTFRDQAESPCPHDNVYCSDRSITVCGDCNEDLGR